jgi:hypothetical protein
MDARGAADTRCRGHAAAGGDAGRGSARRGRRRGIHRTRQPSIEDLVGAWRRQDGINTRYVDRSTGAYAGTDSIHFTEQWEIGTGGTIALDFYGIHNGRRIAEKSTGTVSLSSGGILTIRMTNEQRYVLRGWEEAPDMTVMTLNGPWYDSIPPEILSNPAQGTNLDQRWVRVRAK